MGIWGSICSAVGSALSSVGSVISSGISSICSSIGGALFSGGALSTLATTIVAPFLSLSLPQLMVAAIAVIEVIGALAELLGIKEQETPEELGLKAELADKKPDDFDSIQSYIEYLRKDISLDKEKLSTLSDEQKIQYGAIGSAIYVKAFEEKYEMSMPSEFWHSVTQLKMETQEIKSYLDNFKLHGISDMKDMVYYIKGEPLPDGQNRSLISTAMISALKESNPGVDEATLKEKLLDMKLY